MPADDDKHLITEALKESTVWIADVDAQPTAAGWSVRLLLDPNVAGGRAEQQGLREKSLHAAMRDQSVIDLLDHYIDEVNERLPGGCRIVAREFDLSLEVESEVPGVAKRRQTQNEPARIHADRWPLLCGRTGAG